MNRIQIEEGYRLTVPKKLRGNLKVGDEIVITVDRAGRLVLLSEQRVRNILQQTAGLWQDRADIPKDGVAYVNKLRRGRRLSRLGVTRRASDRH
jgi:bifunctional DNA-binding transcriptional regulator/antitoxin component of YhaV-PrlF toxin-antitoxin module